MLTSQQKQDIYDSLKKGLKLETEMPLASLATYMSDNGISYSEFGYKKFKQLLSGLEFLELKPDQDHNDVFVVIHAFKDDRKKEKKTFTKEEKKKINDILLSHFECGQAYPLSTVADCLSKSKVNYKEFGFSKMKNMLLELTDTLSIKADDSDTGNGIVLFKQAKKEEKVVYPDYKKKPFYLPNEIAVSMSELSSLGLDNNSLLQRIEKDFDKAKKENRVTVKDGCYIFTLSIKGQDGDNLTASIRKSDSKTEYDYFVNYIGCNKEKPKDSFRNDIHFNDIDTDIASLASLAMPEKWSYKNSKDKYIILKIYLQYTYYRVKFQGKIIYDKASGFAFFCTGLKTADYEDIYCVLTKSKDRKIQEDYLFQGFTTAAGQGLGKTVIEHCNPLPRAATYLSSSDDLIFNPAREIHVDIRHIILDNLARFPESFMKKIFLPFNEEKQVLDKALKTKDEFRQKKVYEKLEEMIEKNITLFSILKVTVNTAIERGKSMVNYNYRMALPSFFPTRNVMSMMLPLEFESGKGPEAMLLIELTPAGNYQGQTILTLKQCYVNARLIGRLDHTFLDASKIND